MFTRIIHVSHYKGQTALVGSNEAELDERVRQFLAALKTEYQHKGWFLHSHVEAPQTFNVDNGFDPQSVAQLVVSRPDQSSAA